MSKLSSLLSTEGFNFETSNMTNVQKSLYDYINNLDNYIHYISSALPDKLTTFIEREIFIFNNSNEFEKLKTDIRKILEPLSKKVHTLSKSDSIRRIIDSMNLNKELKLKILI